MTSMYCYINQGLKTLRLALRPIIIIEDLLLQRFFYRLKIFLSICLKNEHYSVFKFAFVQINFWNTLNSSIVN